MNLYALAGIEPDDSQRDEVIAAMVAAALPIIRAGVVIGMADFLSMTLVERDAWLVACDRIEVERVGAQAMMVGNRMAAHKVAVHLGDHATEKALRAESRILDAERRTGVPVVDWSSSAGKSILDGLQKQANV